jgi:capsule polysaccharide export protein KpsE/RkpR
MYGADLIDGPRRIYDKVAVWFGLLMIVVIGIAIMAAIH